MLTQAKSDVVAQTSPAQGSTPVQGAVPGTRAPYVTRQIVRGAVLDALRKLDPRVQIRNPVMFVVFVGSIFTTIIGMGAALGNFQSEGSPGFVVAVAAALWLTVLFANFAEAVAEGRGKAQAAALRSMRAHVHAKKLISDKPGDHHMVAAGSLRRTGATPIVVADGRKALGVIELRDIVKGGIRERFAELRQMGIKTIMVTGDNRLTAAAIAAEAGVDDFLAEATPEKKLELIRKNQSEGRLVAMCGDGTNDAPALAQADVAVAMNTGTQAAKEAGNMVDLDSNPTKLIEVVDVGKQMLVTRGVLTTFSIANDVSKYFAILPAAFAATYPALDALNIMRLTTPQSAILSAVTFNAIVIPMLVPLALRGVKTRAASAGTLLRRNLLIYGLGGVIAPFVGIKVIDVFLSAIGAA